MCQDRTIYPISHDRKALLKVILERMRTEFEYEVAEKQVSRRHREERSLRLMTRERADSQERRNHSESGSRQCNAVADPGGGGSLGSDEPPSGRIRVWWLKTLELVVSE